MNIPKVKYSIIGMFKYDFCGIVFNMDEQTLHDFLNKMYDYADYLAAAIQPENRDNGSYFMSLIYIEDILDSYGRGLILSSAKQIGLDGSAELSEAHRRLDLLRGRIHDLAQQYNFDDDLLRKSEKFKRDWHH